MNDLGHSHCLTSSAQRQDSLTRPRYYLLFGDLGQSWKGVQTREHAAVEDLMYWNKVWGYFHRGQLQVPLSHDSCVIVREMIPSLVERCHNLHTCIC